MECRDVEKVRPLDELMDDTTKEFDSGSDKECDKDLDTMIWELGDFENEESLQEAGEFEDEAPIEDELVEKKMIRGHRASSTEIGGTQGIPFAEQDLVKAESIGSETGRKGSRAVRGRTSGKKKK